MPAEPSWTRLADNRFSETRPTLGGSIMRRPSVCQRQVAQSHAGGPFESVSVGPGLLSTSVSSPVLQPTRSALPFFTAHLTAIEALPIFAQAKMLSLATLSLSLLFSFAAAQSSAVTWIEPGASAAPFAYAGSIVDACPGTTVIALQCTSAGSDNALTDLCGSDAPVRCIHATI